MDAYIVFFIHLPIHPSINKSDTILCMSGFCSTKSLAFNFYSLPIASPWTLHSWAGVRDGQHRLKLACKRTWQKAWGLRPSPRSMAGTCSRRRKPSAKCAAVQGNERNHSFCEQLLPRLKLGKARVLAKSRPGIDVQSFVFTDEKFFRLEQDHRQQRVWLDSVTTKTVRSRPFWSATLGSKRVQSVAYFSARFG